MSAASVKGQKHIQYAIPPLADTPMYVWHKYRGAKTWNVVGEYIEAYTKPGQTVFDPFCGSGVVGVESVRRGRKAIICDLTPIACEIARLTAAPIDVDALEAAFRRVEKRVKSKILDLYATTCRACGKRIPATCFIWSDGGPVEVRYKSCPFCEDRCARAKLDADDVDLYESIAASEIDGWYPHNPLYYSNGQPFKKKEKYESIDQLFTPRNLQAAAWLMAAIDKEDDKELQAFLKGAFTSRVHLATRMMPVVEPKATHHATPFSSPGWVMHSYWSAPMFMEQNVWTLYESAVLGPQGLLRAKHESNDVIGPDVSVRTTDDARDIDPTAADLWIFRGDCLGLMEAMANQDLSADYVFTDPAYGAAIQYGELAYLWTAWLRKDVGYVEALEANEIIENERQGKSLSVYQSLLRRAFSGMHSVLRNGKYVTVTFHSPSFTVRNTVQREGMLSGLDFQSIHYQPPVRASSKSLLQPFGSAQGDFYLRFAKKAKAPTLSGAGLFDSGKFERVIVESAKQVISERAEPTPYTIIINYIDPQLAKHGFWKTTPSGVDVNVVLKAHLGDEFELVPVKIGTVSGKSWWLTDKIFLARLQETPLTERVEQTVLRLLQERGRVTFTEAWRRISMEFPNSLTSDQTSIKEALEAYARQVSGGEWLLKSEIAHRLSEHNAMVERLAWLGKKRGFEVWIGRKEQAAPTELGLFGKQRPHFSEIVDRSSLSSLDVDNVATVEQIDVLWLSDDSVAAVFEVECTTEMTSALLRGSNLPQSTPKFMLIPEERHKTFLRKSESPLFSGHFRDDNWKEIFFDAFQFSFSKEKGNTDLDKLVGVLGDTLKKDESAPRLL